MTADPQRCLICGKGPREHDSGTGLLTCRGIAVPTYRPDTRAPDTELLEALGLRDALIAETLGKLRIAEKLSDGEAAFWRRAADELEADRAVITHKGPSNAEG